MALLFLCSLAVNQSNFYAGKSHISSQSIVAIVVPISIFVVLLFMGFCFFMRWKARKKYNAVQEENGKE